MSTQSTETEDASRVYYPTYELHEGLTAGTAAWLSDQQGDGPLAHGSSTGRAHASLRGTTPDVSR